MAVKDPEIYKIVEKIGDHYTTNVNNRFVRKVLVTLDLQQSEWDKLDGLTQKSDYFKAQGFQFDELYEMILAAAHFIYKARQSILPNVKNMISGSLLSQSREKGSEQDKILRDMAARNFPVNLQILTDLVNELYVKTTNLDKQAHEKKTPVFEKIPELRELGHYLVT
jgi:hypothetical protein